jgi:hypothetical protein
MGRGEARCVPNGMQTFCAAEERASTVSERRIENAC